MWLFNDFLKLLSSAMHSTDDSDWPGHSSMLTIRVVLLCNDHLSPFPTVWYFSSTSYWQTWPSHDRLRGLMVYNYWQGHWDGCSCNCLSVMPLVWCAKHPPAAFVFKGMHSSLQIQSTFSSHIRTAVLRRWVICRVLVFVENDRFLFPQTSWSTTILV